MIAVRVLCHDCGNFYTASINAENKRSLCPAQDCAKKRKTCVNCNNIAKYTQPDKDTGDIVDVCDKHFIYKYMG